MMQRIASPAAPSIHGVTPGATRKQRPFPPGSRMGFTLIELTVIIGIITLLSAILLGVYARSKRASGNAVCLSNLRQQHAALADYLEDFDGAFPMVNLQWDTQSTTRKTERSREVLEAAERRHPRAIQNLFYPYLRSREVFHCPLDTGTINSFDQRLGSEGKSNYERFGTSYRAAAELGLILSLNVSEIPEPTRIFWSTDGAGYWHTTHSRNPRHEYIDDTGYRNDMNVWRNNTVYLDGHTRSSTFMADVWVPYVDFLQARM